VISFRRRKQNEDALLGADALTAAEALAQNDRRLDAIDLLTEANRAEPDAAIEERLVRLRHGAFDELQGTKGPNGLPAWPPDAPDLFPGARLPEVERGELSAETLRSGILRHGCLLVRGLVGPDHVARLINDIDAAMTAVEAWRGDRSLKGAPWFVPFTSPRAQGLGKERPWVVDGGGVWTVDSPRALFDVMETFAAIGLEGPLTDYLGERPALSVKKWTLRRVPVTVVEPGSVFQPNWHQDGAFLGQGIRTVNFWLTLSHCGDTAPGLDIVPRRMEEILPTGTDGALVDWSVGEGLVQKVAEQTPIARPVFEPGDALFFDERLLHRTAVSDAMTHERYAIESWFFAPSQYPPDQLPVVF
jgi:hypothetical protein